MEKFAKAITLIIFTLTGCASVPMSGYISRVDRAYDGKIYAGLEKTTSAFMFVLKNQGWTVANEVDPGIYERDDRYENNGYQNLLIVTDMRKHFLHLTGTRLNVFIHAIGNICDVEIRFSSGRHDSVAQGILDAVQQEIKD